MAWKFHKFLSLSSRRWNLLQTNVFDATDAVITGEEVVIPKIWSKGSLHGNPGGAVTWFPGWLFKRLSNDGTEGDGPTFAAVWVT